MCVKQILKSACASTQIRVITVRMTKPGGHTYPISVWRISLTVPMRCLFCGSFLLFMFRICHSLWLPAGKWLTSLLSCMLHVCLLYICHVPMCVLGQAGYLIVSIPDRCLLTYTDWDNIQNTPTLRLAHGVFCWFICRVWMI